MDYVEEQVNQLQRHVNDKKYNERRYFPRVVYSVFGSALYERQKRLYTNLHVLQVLVKSLSLVIFRVYKSRTLNNLWVTVNDILPNARCVI